MKKYLLLIFFSITVIKSFAQTVDDSVHSIDDYYIDLSVPDLSAFALLNVNPTQVVKPSSVKEFAIGLSGLDSGGKIKPSFALSWSPFQTFAKKNQSVDDYKRNYWWKYAFQVTSATSSDSTGTNLAFGLNWVPIDHSNILKYFDHVGEMNSAINSYDRIDSLQKIVKEENTFFELLYKKNTSLSQINRAKKYDQIINLLTANLHPNHFGNDDRSLQPDEIKDILVKYILEDSIPPDSITKGEKDTLLMLSENYLSQLKGDEKAKQEIEEGVKKNKAAFKKANWNAFRLQLSSGIVLNSGDGSWNNLTGKKWVSLVTTNLPLANWGEFIVMAKYSNLFKSDTTYKSQFFAGARLLVGNSNLQISLEGGYSNYKALIDSNNSQNLRTTLGVDVKITDGIWFEIATGLNEVIKGQTKTYPIALGTFKYAFHKKNRFDIH